MPNDRVSDRDKSYPEQLGVDLEHSGNDDVRWEILPDRLGIEVKITLLELVGEIRDVPGFELGRRRIELFLEHEELLEIRAGPLRELPFQPIQEIGHRLRAASHPIAD